MSLIEQALNKSSEEIRDPAFQPPSLISNPVNILKISSAPGRNKLGRFGGALLAVCALLGVSLFLLRMVESRLNEPSFPAAPRTSDSLSRMANSPASKSSEAVPAKAEGPSAVSRPATVEAADLTQVSDLPVNDADDFPETAVVSSSPGVVSRDGDDVVSSCPSTADPGPTPSAQSNTIDELLIQAYACAERGKYNEALRCYDEILTISSTHYEARLNRGIIFQHRGDYAAAQEDLIAALRSNPDDPVLLNALGVVYLTKGERDNARGCFRKAGDATSLINLALSYWQEGDPQKVFATLTEAATHDANDPYVCYYLGLFYRQQHNFNAGREQFEKAAVLARKRGNLELLSQLQALSGAP